MLIKDDMNSKTLAELKFRDREVLMTSLRQAALAVDLKPLLVDDTVTDRRLAKLLPGAEKAYTAVFRKYCDGDERLSQDACKEYFVACGAKVRGVAALPATLPQRPFVGTCLLSLPFTPVCVVFDRATT